jgi:preprotein translocase subunit YajC
MLSLLFLLAAFGAMWYFMIRPQQQQLRQHQQLVASLEVGDEVLTSSGIFGTIVGFEGDDDDIMALEVAEGVVLSVKRGAVTEVAVEDVDELDDPAEEV